MDRNGVNLNAFMSEVDEMFYKIYGVSVFAFATCAIPASVVSAILSFTFLGSLTPSALSAYNVGFYGDRWQAGKRYIAKIDRSLDALQNLAL